MSGAQSAAARRLPLLLGLLALAGGLVLAGLIVTRPAHVPGWRGVGSAPAAAPRPTAPPVMRAAGGAQQGAAAASRPGEAPPAGRAAAAAPPAQSSAAAPVYSYRVLHTYPHDPTAFTQGLVYTDGVLYEGTGMRGDSSLRKVDLETGAVLQQHDLPAQYFGEGIVVLTSTIIQLTWQEHVAFLYDRETFSQTGTFSYATEGWGLAYDGRQLIMSDGSATLFFRDPQTFDQIGQVQVLDGTTPVARLNELEYIAGEVYANVWLTDSIVRIDPATGQVAVRIDLTGLRPPGANVLNGIAYDALGERLFVTGKYWPYLYEIELVPPPVRFYLPYVVR